MRPFGLMAAAAEDPLLPAAAQRNAARHALFAGLTLFFTVGPLLGLLQRPPAPVPLALLLAGWAVFGAVVVRLFRTSPFGIPDDGRWYLAASAALTAIAFLAQVAFGIPQAAALYYYAGVSVARVPHRLQPMLAIGLVSMAALVGTGMTQDDPAAGLDIAVTVGAISLTLAALASQGRTNRALVAARLELAEVAVAGERTRIARDLHDTLGHSLSLIALKSELARRVLADDPERAAGEIADVERTAREALASVRETVAGYRRPTLSMELAGAREAFRSAGIDAVVEPAPDGLPPEIDGLLGWAVREGVTNVLRHSGARSARIRVVADALRVEVEITDDGEGSGARATGAVAGGGAALGGSGLAGLRERASALGGAVEAAAVPRGGFRLAVRVPRGSAE